MPQSERKKKIVLVCVVATILLTLGSRIAVARYLASDAPGDGLVYSQLARNVLEHHVYSNDDQPPFSPTLIRMPGYPLFIAGIYAVFGHGNNTAVRMVQALLDTCSCLLIALIAWNWDPDERRRNKTAAIAFALAALCPFAIIYVGTILSETATIFLACAMTLTATYALKSRQRTSSYFWWITTGLIGGISVTFRPDAGLFLGGIGLTLVLSYLFGDRGEEQPFSARFSRAVIGGALMSVAFAAVLSPWAVRNRILFHVFQPLSPAHAEMPGEFVPLGYDKWVRTWIDDGRYIDPFLWSLDSRKINIDDVPKRAFDSEDERQRVAALLEKYNNPPGAPTATEGANTEQEQQEGSQAASNANDNQSDSSAADESDDSSDNQNDSDEADDSADQSDDESDNSDEPAGAVEMTPEIDAGFAQIANERIAHAPFRYYVSLPLKRAEALWFDTHSTYFPFDGELFPFSDLDYDAHQQYWLPLFTILVWVYTALGIYGAYVLWGIKGGRKWVLLAALMTLPRLAFFSTLENPEPRYVVELFAFCALTGAFAFARLFASSELD
jgi:hypothetical protein